MPRRWLGVRAIAVGRKNWTFAGSDSGGRRAADIYTLIETARFNDIDVKVWLADVLARIANHPMHRIDELLPWNWKAAQAQTHAALSSPNHLRSWPDAYVKAVDWLPQLFFGLDSGGS